jgi:DNA-binding CsgD family transcriptional regulator
MLGDDDLSEARRLGAAMPRAREPRAAREPLRLGLDLAVACGATRLADRARTEPTASGARPRRPRVTGRDALTARELRVAHLVAEGRTNAEVAQSLFVTTNTVDTHLSHVYAKLRISSRHQLADALEPTGD